MNAVLPIAYEKQKALNVNNTMDISSRKISILKFGISLNLPRMISQDVVGKVILALRGIKY